MANNAAIVENAVKAALDDIKKYSPETFEKLVANPKKKEEILQAARAAAEEEVKLAGIHGLCDPGVLEKHLPKDRIKAIKEGLTIPTYKLSFRTKGAATFVDIARHDKEFMPSRQLAMLADTNWTKYVQYASIIVEAVLLVMSAVGITVEVSDSVIAKVADETVAAIESSSLLQKAVQNLQEVWENGGSAYEKAKAIFVLIKDSYSAGILWNIIKSLCSNMSWWDWTKTAAMVTAMIVAALATDGAALIAKIILALNSAYEFGKKIANLTQISTVQKNL